MPTRNAFERDLDKPKKVVFGELPKTSTGKIQKFLLRERARSTAAIG